MILEVYYKVIDSPLGPLHLLTSERALCGVFYDSSKKLSRFSDEAILNNTHPVLLKTEGAVVD